MIDASPTGDKGADVTEQLQKLVDPETNTIVFESGQTLNSLFGDPEPFHIKVLKVEYTVPGESQARQQKIFEFSTGRRVIGTDSAPDQEPERPKVPQLEVEKAVYGGSAGSQKDVTERIRELIDSATQSIIIPATVKFNSFFEGDPAPFAAKELKISYKTGGVDGELVLPEKRKEDVCIPPIGEQAGAQAVA